MKQEKRVVITGWGFYGSEFEDGSFGEIESKTIKSDNMKTIFARAEEPDLKVLLPGISTRLVDRQSILAGIAAGRAIRHYLESEKIDRSKTGIAVGSTFGSIVSILKFHKNILTEGGKFANPTEFPNVVSNAAASRLGIWYGIKGHCISLSDGLLSGIDAVGFAYDDIRRGRMDHYIAGDAEEFSNEFYEAYIRMIEDRLDFGAGDRICSEILCEGAGIAVLSGLEAAKACNMNIIGEITGYLNTTYRKDEFLPEKVIDAVIEYFTGQDNLSSDDLVFFTSLNPLSRISGHVVKEAEKRLGKDNVYVKNRQEDTIVNYFGLGGIMNMKSALDSAACGDKKKMAVVLEADDDGNVSALLVKRFVQ